MSRVKDAFTKKGLIEAHHKTYESFKGEDPSFQNEPEKNFVLKKSVEMVDGIWEEIKIDNLLDIKLGYFLDENRRIMLSFEINKDMVYAVSSERDYNALRLKKPKDIIIYISDLLRFWTGHIALSDANDPIFKAVPAIMTVLKVFPDAKIVSYS